jgi:hypothetical protein
MAAPMPDVPPVTSTRFSENQCAAHSNDEGTRCVSDCIASPAYRTNWST